MTEKKDTEEKSVEKVEAPAAAEEASASAKATADEKADKKEEKAKAKEAAPKAAKDDKKADDKPKKEAKPKAKKTEEAPKEEAKVEAPKEDAPKNEPIKDLKDIGGAVDADAAKPEEKAEDAGEDKEEQAAPIVRVQKVDELGRAYATGRRKDAVARVWLKPGSGKVVVNGRDQTVYFARQTQRLVLNQPFLIVSSVGKYDVMATVKGGGLSGQAGAVRHGISRALENYDPALRPQLKKAGMLTRDDRIVERKKVGKHKARRSKQWAKR